MIDPGDRAERDRNSGKSTGRGDRICARRIRRTAAPAAPARNGAGAEPAVVIAHVDGDAACAPASGVDRG